MTMVLATLLFVKYIFFDKSEIFATSVPPTLSAHLQDSSRSIKASSSSSSSGSTSCPFDLSQVGNSSITRHRTTPNMKINVDLPKPVRRHGPPEELEKIRNGGMVIMSGRDTSAESANSNRRLAALECPQSQSTNNQDNTDGGRIGRVLTIEDKVSRADFLLSKPTFASIGVQTEPLPDLTRSPSRSPKHSMFSIGGASADGRKDSVVSYPDSGIENGQLDLDTGNGAFIQSAEPRPLLECLNIFKSDVSTCIICQFSLSNIVKRQS